MNILHIASHEINVGDGALNSVIQSYFNGNTFEQLDIHSSEKYFWENRYKDTFDKVVIGGGGSITASHENENRPIQFRIDAHGLSHKMAFVALGENNFYGQAYKPVQIRTLKAILRRCGVLRIPFSVRDDGSAERVEELTGVKPIAIPDPGLFVKVDDNFKPEVVLDGRKNIILQLAGDNLGLRFGEQKIYDRFIVELVEYSKLMIEKYDANIILTPHIFRDVDVCTFFWKVFQATLGTMGRKNLRQAPITGPAEYAKFFKIYKDADLVIGMRGHSAICGVGLGTPTIAIDTHPKVRGFMDRVGLSNWVVTPSDFSRDKAVEMSTMEFRPRLNGARETLDNFMKVVLDGNS